MTGTSLWQSEGGIRCAMNPVAEMDCHLDGPSQSQAKQSPVTIKGGVGADRTDEPILRVEQRTCEIDSDLCGEQLKFRDYQLIPGARLLVRNGEAVELGSRAFDLLHILLSSRGTLVTKEQIVRHVWPETTVEESNLRFQMTCLRKALGNDRDLIKTIPGRGYLFATNWRASIENARKGPKYPH